MAVNQPQYNHHTRRFHDEATWPTYGCYCFVKCFLGVPDSRAGDEEGLQQAEGQQG